MLALPPYELKDEDAHITKEQFCLKLADLVAEILECGGKDLEKLEIKWQKDGTATFRTLFKKHEAPAADAAGEIRCTVPTVSGSADRSPDAVDVVSL